jgi:hypothetical protein
LIPLVLFLHVQLSLQDSLVPVPHLSIQPFDLGLIGPQHAGQLLDFFLQGLHLRVVAFLLSKFFLGLSEVEI